LIGGLVILFAMVAVPPWFNPIDKITTYGFLFNPPENFTKIDFTRLITQIILVIISCAIFELLLIQKSEPNTEVELGTENDTKRFPFIVVGSILFGIIGAAGFTGFITDHQENFHRSESLKDLQHSQKLTSELQRRAAKNAATEQAAQYAQALKDQSEQAALVETLARPKDWGPRDAGERGVKIRPVTYWNNELLVLRVQLFGEVQNLEIATGKHKSYAVELSDSTGIANYAFKIAGEDFHPYKGKRGGITTMMTEPLSRSCSLSSYQTLSNCQARVEWR